MPTYLNPTDTEITLPYSSVFKRHKTVVAPGRSVETTLYLLDSEVTALGLQKTSEEPFARISNALNEVVFSAAQTKEVTGLLDSKILRVKTNVDIIIKPNDPTNPYGYHLGSFEGFVDIRNDHEIEKLYLTSSGSGTSYVIELDK
jgi:hypothetical protein